MNKNIVSALNEQINAEFYSAYYYLSLSIAMNDEKYPGYASWLKKQYEEEVEHAFKFISYLEERDEQVVLKDIKVEKAEETDPLAVAKAVLAHEEVVTASIHAIYGDALADKDYGTVEFLNWFVSEQVEEEANAREVVDAFETAGPERAHRMYADAKVGERE